MPKPKMVAAPKLRLTKYTTSAGVEIELLRNRLESQCRLTAWDKPTICPQCNDQVLPGQQHTCVKYPGGPGRFSKRTEKVKAFES